MIRIGADSYAYGRSFAVTKILFLNRYTNSLGSYNRPFKRSFRKYYRTQPNLILG